MLYYSNISEFPSTDTDVTSIMAKPVLSVLSGVNDGDSSSITQHIDNNIQLCRHYELAAYRAAILSRGTPLIMPVQFVDVEA